MMTNDSFGIAFLEDDGLVHWAPWFVHAEDELQDALRRITDDGERAWVICGRSYEEVKTRTSYVSTNSRDVTCLSCASQLGCEREDL